MMNRLGTLRNRRSQDTRRNAGRHAAAGWHGLETLEGRLMMSADPLGMALGAAGDCGPPVGEGKYYESADADGDGKLGLADVPTKSEQGRLGTVIAYEPVWAMAAASFGFGADRTISATSYDFGASSSEDGKVDVPGSAAPDGAPEPTSLTFNGRGIDLNEDAMVDTLNSPAPDGAPEPTSLTFNGRGIDLNDDGPMPQMTQLGGGQMQQPLAEGPTADIILAFLLKAESASAGNGGVFGPGSDPFVRQSAEPPVGSDERPIIIDILGSTEDFESASSDGGQIGMAEVDTQTDGFTTVPFIQEPGEKPVGAQGPHDSFYFDFDIWDDDWWLEDLI